MSFHIDMLLKMLKLSVEYYTEENIRYLECVCFFFFSKSVNFFLFIFILAVLTLIALLTGVVEYATYRGVRHLLAMGYDL